MAIDIVRAQGTTAVPRSPSRDRAVAGLRLPRLRRRVGGRDIIYFTSLLSLMMEVGTSLTDAVAALEKQTANPTLRNVLRALEDDMQEDSPSRPPCPATTTYSTACSSAWFGLAKRGAT